MTRAIAAVFSLALAGCAASEHRSTGDEPLPWTVTPADPGQRPKSVFARLPRNPEFVLGGWKPVVQ